MMSHVVAQRDAWCPNCGEGYANSQGNCMRCGSGAVIAATHNTIDRHGGTVVDVGEPKTIRLPNTRQTQRWLDETRTYAMALEQQAKDAQDKVKGLQRDANHLADASAALGGLLDRLGVQKGAPVVASPKRAPNDGGRLNGRWSRLHDACVECHDTASPHKAKGLCAICLQRAKRKQAA